MNELQDVFETISVKAEGISSILLIMSTETNERCICAALDYLSDAVREIEQIADDAAKRIYKLKKEPQG